VAEHAVGRAGRPTGSAVVLGAGAVGTLVALVLRDSGLRDVTLVDADEGRRQQAAALTAFPAVDAVPRFAPGAGVTLFECSGSAGALNAALRAVPVRTHVVLVEVHSEATPTDLDALLHKEITLTGSSSHSRADFVRAVGRLARSPETFRPLLGRRAGLDDAPAALTRLAHTHDAGKLLVGGQEDS